MAEKSLTKRALKFALISSSIIMLFVLFSVLIQGAVGSTIEIIGRLIVSTIGVFISMWVLFICYLFFNPDADKPRDS